MVRAGKVSVAAVAALMVLVTGGCGDDAQESDEPTSPSSSAPAESGSESPATGSPSAEAPEAPEATTIDVTIENGEVSPSGDRVEAAVGETIVFSITSDVAGEMHVHSAPEQEIAFTPGTTEHELTIETPGVVAVELHDPALTVVQLEVR